MTVGFMFTASTALAAEGRLLWQNRGQGSDFHDGQAQEVAVQGDVAVEAGEVCRELYVFPTCDWFVRAHEVKTGTTLWEDRLDVEGRYDRATRVAVDEERAFVSGWVRSLAQGYDFVVRAYDLRRGRLLWQQRIHRGSVDTAETVRVRAGRVIVGGRLRGASSDFALFAFDARTGDKLWENVTDPSGLSDQIKSLVVDDDRVFVSGQIRNFTSDTSLLVRAHDVRTGAILWEQEIVGGDNVGRHPNLLAVHGELLYSASTILDAVTGDYDFLVRAYDTETGALRWEDRMRDPTSGGEASGLSVAGNRLYVSGLDGCDSDFQCQNWVVRAYDAETGALRWENRMQEPAGGGAITQTIVAKAGRVFVGGQLLNASGSSYEWTLRAYDARTGALTWQERLPDDGAIGGAVFSLALQGNRLFAAGELGRADGGDFTVRAYDVRRRDSDSDSEKESDSNSHSSKGVGPDQKR